jgi:predicted AlkP superfamily pyrophosphatase or phosphodiesterase
MSAPIYSMMDIAPTISRLLDIPVPAGAQGTPIPPLAAAVLPPAKVAVLAPDGLGCFAWGQWRSEMPFLNNLHERHSITLRSVLPSITPVNFAAMVTGTDVPGHGVQSMEDPFGCETIFSVLRQAGKLSAAAGLDDYTGTRLLGRAADICGNAGSGDDADVVDCIEAIAADSAPEFIIAQLGRVDDVFHQFGPSSPEVVPMLRRTDLYLQRLAQTLTERSYTVIFLADHGHHDVPENTAGELKGSHGTARDEDCLVPCTWLTPNEKSSMRWTTESHKYDNCHGPFLI